MVHAPVPHRSRTVLLGIVLPAAFLVGALLLVLVWRDRLPAEVAVHWGPTGVDRTGTLAELVAVPMVLGAAGWLIVSILCLTTARIELMRRLLVGVGSGLGALFAGITLSSVAVQLDITDASTATDPTIGVVVTMAVAIAVGGFAATLAGNDPPLPSPVLVPADAPRSDLPGSAYWAGEARTRHVWPIWLMTAVLVGAGVWFGNATHQWWAVVPFVLVGALPLHLLRWRVRIDHRGLTVAGQPGWPRQRIPANEVVRADVIEVQPFREFGGWGLRIAGDGRTGVVTRAGAAIQVQRSGDRVFVVTIDGAAEAAALLNTIADRSRRHTVPGDR